MDNETRIMKFVLPVSLVFSLIPSSQCGIKCLIRSSMLLEITVLTLGQTEVGSVILSGLLSGC